MSPWNNLPELIFITQNPNKVQDAEKIITSFSINHVNFEVPEIQSLDPKEVIEHKLLFAYEKIQKPCFVMDASLFFDCLNWFPWPLIKFWFEKSVGAEKTCKICSLLDNNACKRTSTLWYYDWINKTFLEETIAWTIAPEPKWSNWYHRDTIFIPQGSTQTLAEMSFEEKQEFAVTKKLLLQLETILTQKNEYE